jgi:predicted nuclease of predicted toxin-antitoxin system
LNIKLDENLPDRLVAALEALGHDIDTVYAERLNGQSDPNVWAATQAARRFFITQDLDFSDIRRYTPGTHAGLLLVRLSQPGRDALFERVVTVFRTENVEDWRGCLVVVTDRKVRVRRSIRPTPS